MTDAVSFFDILRTAVAGLIVAGGLSLMLGGAIGMLRFPDVYTRAHAGNVANGAGASIVAAGLAVSSADPGMAMRLVLLAVLIWSVGPLLSHLVASAAHAQGLAPFSARPVKRGKRKSGAS